jgi:2-keto-3-deoxy-L-rhamnonate aldolase RhmA
MRGNRLRELLQAGKPTLGTHLLAIWPSIVELVGESGVFDYVEFVAEYGPHDLAGLENFCRAAELHNLSSMIKVDQQPRTSLAQRGIGAGFHSVLFADCRSIDDARECIRAARPETPEDQGTYGAEMRRHTYKYLGLPPEEEYRRYVQAIRDVVVVLMIEKKGAVEQLEEILALPGIDMIQWGPADYSISVGRPGQWATRELKEVEKRVFETALKMGVPPRCEISSPDEAKYYLDMGVRHFCIGWDTMVWFDWCRANGEAMRKALKEL